MVKKIHKKNNNRDKKLRERSKKTHKTHITSYVVQSKVYIHG